MNYIFGLLIAGIAVVTSVVHLQQSASNYWDFVAFACVMGGTLAVSIMILPWQHFAEIKLAFRSLFLGFQRVSSQTLKDCFQLIRAIYEKSAVYTPQSTGMAADILKDAKELIELGFEKNKVLRILEDRIIQNHERALKVAQSLRSLAKYPPAFGLTGTVLGLVSLMRSVSSGADAKQTGLLMAIALVATMYGLLMANLFIAPAGESLVKCAVEEKKKAEIALVAVELAMDHATLLEAQETLNSYVSYLDRINVISTSESEAA